MIRSLNKKIKNKIPKRLKKQKAYSTINCRQCTQGLWEK